MILLRSLILLIFCWAFVYGMIKTIRFVTVREWREVGIVIVAGMLALALATFIYFAEQT